MALDNVAIRLAKQELDRRDVYIAKSPKEGRAVTVVGLLRLSFWLERKFDPAVQTCVERLRQLELHEGRTVELDSWTRSTKGAETFWTLIGTDELLSTKNGIQLKEASLWD